MSSLFQQKCQRPEIIRKKSIILLITLKKSSQKEEKSDLLSEQILSFLKTCSLNDLKLITPDTLADTFNYSRHYIPRKFAEEQGYSVHNAIIYEKMNRAFQILSDPENTLAVKEIAQQLGFTDARYFSDLFKTKFGKTPSSIIKESI